MKILVIDDHALIREALRGVLKELKGEATIAEAPDWRQARLQIEQNADFDLILLDLNLPDRDGFEILAEMRERYPAISIVVLSARHDRESVAKALNLGALGFIPKSAQREVMLSALSLIFSGGMYIPPEILTGQAQTQSPPAPAPATRLRTRELVELTEYVALLILRYARAAVPYVQSQPFTAVATADHHPAASRVAHGVGYQVEKDSFEQNEIGADPGTARHYV